MTLVYLWGEDQHVIIFIHALLLVYTHSMILFSESLPSEMKYNPFEAWLIYL